MPTLFLTLGILAVSASPLLIRFAQPVEPVAIAGYRVLIAGGILAVLGWRQWPQIFGLSKKEFGLLVLAGCALGLHFGLWVTSLALTSTTASVALVATQPIFAGLLGWLVLREGFSRQEYWGILVALIGTLVLAGGDLGGATSDAILGDALAIGGAITVPIYLLAGRKLGEKLPLWAYLSCVNLIAAALLFGYGTAMDVSFGGIAQEDLIAIIALAAIPSVIGHTLLNYCVRVIPVHLVSLGILAEPVIATLSTWAAFREIPSGEEVMGATIILLGIGLGFSRGWLRRLRDV